MFVCVVLNDHVKEITQYYFLGNRKVRRERFEREQEEEIANQGFPPINEEL